MPAARAASVRATLYYQALPPYYLAQRFATAHGPDAQRLYSFASYLELRGTPVEGWKLLIARATAAAGG